MPPGPRTQTLFSRVMLLRLTSCLLFLSLFVSCHALARTTVSQGARNDLWTHFKVC